MTTITVHAQCNVRARALGAWSENRVEVATFSFDAADPAAVTLNVDGVPWVFDRTLLEGAVADMTIPCNVMQGEGDVQVHRPGMSRVIVELITPEGQARIDVAAAIVSDFVRQVTEACPEPTYDVDAWLRGLAGSEEGAS